MGELINGRTPEEIKAKAVTCTMLTCSECPYEKEEYFCAANDVMDNLLAYVKHLEAQQPKWISVEERLPENEECVLITVLYDRYYGKPHRTVMTAFHTNGKLPAGQSLYNWEEGSVEMQYDEEADDFIVPEGWWEDVQCGDEFSMVCAKVTHWMPLPEPPEVSE